MSNAQPLTIPNPWAQQSMQPLCVTAELRTPVACYETVMLDAILATVNLEELRRRHLIPGAYQDVERGAQAAGQALDIPLPLARLDWPEASVWCASIGFFQHSTESVQVWHKRFEDDDRIRYRSKHPATTKVPLASGHFRSYAMPLVIRSAPTLRWWVRGYQPAIERLLSAVSHVGKKISQGYGEVRRWRIEPCAEDWSVVREGRVMRPVPRALAEARGWIGTRRWMPVRPPYWDATLCVDALAP